MQKIIPFLWFDTNAKQAVDFYVSIFKNSKVGRISFYGEEASKAAKMPKGTEMVVTFTLNGQNFMALNGGPIFKFTPAISFFVHAKTEKELDELFKKLSSKGEILMPLDKYPFSEKYAFFKDKFGVAWQLMLSPEKDNIAPCLLFVGKDLGNAKAAVSLYTKIFKNSSIEHMSFYEKGEPGKQGTVKHSSFLLEGQQFMAMDGTGPHTFTFNESISFLVNAKAQQEVDYLWEKLSLGGQKGQCGWLKDKFGVSWQIVPTVLGEMMQDKNPKKASKVMQAMLKMTKIDIQELKHVYNSV